MRAASDEPSQAATRPSTSARSPGPRPAQARSTPTATARCSASPSSAPRSGPLGERAAAQPDHALGVVREAAAVVQRERAVGERARHVQRRPPAAAASGGGQIERPARRPRAATSKRLSWPRARARRLLGAGRRRRRPASDLGRVDVHAHRHARDRDVGDARLERRRDDRRTGRARAGARCSSCRPATRRAAAGRGRASRRRRRPDRSRPRRPPCRPPRDGVDGPARAPCRARRAGAGRARRRGRRPPRPSRRASARERSGTHTTGNSRPLAAWIVISATASSPPPGGASASLRSRVVAEPHLLDEPGQVGPAIALVGARRPHQLAHVAEAALAVGRGQAGQVVVVLGDDALQQCSQPELAACAHEAVVELLEALHERAIALGQALQLPQLDRPVERALRRRAQREQPVVGDADERRGEHDEQRVVVEAVAQQGQVGAQVAHLLRAVEAPAELAARHQADALQRRGVRRGVARGAQQHGDPARARPRRRPARAGAVPAHCASSSRAGAARAAPSPLATRCSSIAGSAIGSTVRNACGGSKSRSSKRWPKTWPMTASSSGRER